MFGEFASVVGCDGLHVLLVGFEQPDGCPCYIVRVLSMRQPLHEQEAGLAFDDGENEILAVLYEIHLKVPELFSFLHVFRPFMDGDPVGDVPDTCAGRPFAVPEAVPAVLVQRAAVAFVLAHEPINPFHGHHLQPVGIAVALDLLRRPLRPLHFLAYEVPHGTVKLVGAVAALLHHVGEHPGGSRRVAPFGVRIAPELLADSGLRHPDVSGDFGL